MTPSRKIAFNVLAVCLCVFVLVAANTTLFNQQPNLAIFGMLGVVLVFLMKPACKWCPENKLLRRTDWFLIVATLLTFGYVFVQSEPKLEAFWVDGTVLGDRAGNETATDFAISLVGLLLVFEATRCTYRLDPADTLHAVYCLCALRPKYAGLAVSAPWIYVATGGTEILLAIWRRFRHRIKGDVLLRLSVCSLWHFAGANWGYRLRHQPGKKTIPTSTWRPGRSCPLSAAP